MKKNVSVLLSEQFYSTNRNVSDQLTLLKASGARVFLSFTSDRDFLTVQQEANRQDLYGPSYVWFSIDGGATRLSYLNNTSDVTSIDPLANQTLPGAMGTQVANGYGSVYQGE